MKVLLNLAVFALWSALQKPATSSGVADEFCLAKEAAGNAPGTVFNLYETCQMCACDGAKRKFCTSDPACKRKKQEEYDAINRRPCYRGGSKFTFGSQVQQDCNICTCNNATWFCTTDDCGYETGGGDREDKKEDTASESEEEPSCEDEDKRCSSWITKKRQDLCTTNKYVGRKCRNSCNNCPKKKEETKPVEEEEEEVCEDQHQNCEAWVAKRKNLCKTRKYMKANCKRSCNNCGKKEKNEVTEEVGREEEEAGAEEETREKTAEELEEERRQQEIAAWRDRLIAEGQLIDTSKTPIGCVFNCGGTVYPWGSALQDSHCGVCTCKRRSRLDYYFKCTNSECETTCIQNT